MEQDRYHSLRVACHNLRTGKATIEQAGSVLNEGGRIIFERSPNFPVFYQVIRIINRESPGFMDTPLGIHVEAELTVQAERKIEINNKF